MQKRYSQNNLLVPNGFSLKTSNLLRFASIFIITVAQFQIFSLNVSASVNSYKNFTTFKKTEKSFSDKSISSEIPFHSGQSSQGIDAEVEPTEDDIHQDISGSFSESLHKFYLKEFIYTSFIKARYLRLAFSIHRQAKVPCFILNHSWKSQLA